MNQIHNPHTITRSIDLDELSFCFKIENCLVSEVSNLNKLLTTD